MKTLRLFLSIILLSGLAWAQSPSRETADQPATVIHAGHLLDVKNGRMVDNATVVVQGDKIVSLGPPQWSTPPANVKEINLPDATLLPGLIDAHTHLTFDPNFGYQELGVSV